MNIQRGIALVVNYSSQKRSEYSWTLVLMEIFGSTKKELPNIPYTEWQMAKSYHTSAGIFQTKGQAKFAMEFFE